MSACPVRIPTRNGRTLACDRPAGHALAHYPKIGSGQPAALTDALTDALTICNGCDAAVALPDSAAGYCAACDALAKGS